MWKFWPMKLLCKLVTNTLKPMVCAHPINLCNSLGSGLSDLHHCVGCGRGPWLESVINFPFLPVALSWRPSLFPLGDSDIGHNTLLQSTVLSMVVCWPAPLDSSHWTPAAPGPKLGPQKGIHTLSNSPSEGKLPRSHDEEKELKLFMGLPWGWLLKDRTPF